MRLSLMPVVVLAPVVIGSAVLQRQETQDIQIVLQVSKIKDQAAIDVYNQDKLTLLAQSCARSLQSGGLDIAFAVNGNGAGTFTVGSQTYTVSDDLTISGGAICDRISSDDELLVNCVVPYSQPLPALAKRDLKICFPEGPIHLVEVLQGFEASAADESAFLTAEEAEAAAEAAQAAADLSTTTASPLDKRQGSCGFWSTHTHRTGNGDPHQNPWHVQLSVPMECATGRTCSIQHSESYTIGWSVNFGGSYNWIDAGFSVQKSVETGNAHTCDGNARDYFAIWRETGTTAYTVHNLSLNQCSSSVGGNFIIWSPNRNDKYSRYYCVYGRNYVRQKGDRYLDKSAGRPYGP